MTAASLVVTHPPCPDPPLAGRAFRLMGADEAAELIHLATGWTVLRNDDDTLVIWELSHPT